MNLWPFGGRMTTDDSEEHIHLENTRRAVQNSVDLQVRMRQSHTMAVEQDVQRLQREIRDMTDEVLLMKKYIKALERTAVGNLIDLDSAQKVIEGYRARIEGATYEQEEEQRNAFFKAKCKDDAYLDPLEATVKKRVRREMGELKPVEQQLWERMRF